MTPGTESPANRIPKETLEGKIRVDWAEASYCPHEDKVQPKVISHEIGDKTIIIFGRDYSGIDEDALKKKNAGAFDLAAAKVKEGFEEKMRGAKEDGESDADQVKRSVRQAATEAHKHLLESDKECHIGIAVIDHKDGALYLAPGYFDIKSSETELSSLITGNINQYNPFGSESADTYCPPEIFFEPENINLNPGEIVAIGSDGFLAIATAKTVESEIFSDPDLEPNDDNRGLPTDTETASATAERLISNYKDVRDKDTRGKINVFSVSGANIELIKDGNQFCLVFQAKKEEGETPAEPPTPPAPLISVEGDFPDADKRILITTVKGSTTTREAMRVTVADELSAQQRDWLSQLHENEIFRKDIDGGISETDVGAEFAFAVKSMDSRRAEIIAQGIVADTPEGGALKVFYYRTEGTRPAFKVVDSRGEEVELLPTSGQIQEYTLRPGERIVVIKPTGEGTQTLPGEEVPPPPSPSPMPSGVDPKATVEIPLPGVEEEPYNEEATGRRFTERSKALVDHAKEAKDRMTTLVSEWNKTDIPAQKTHLALAMLQQYADVIEAMTGAGDILELANWTNEQVLGQVGADERSASKYWRETDSLWVNIALYITETDERKINEIGVSAMNERDRLIEEYRKSGQGNTAKQTFISAIEQAQQKRMKAILEIVSDAGKRLGISDDKNSQIVSESWMAKELDWTSIAKEIEPPPSESTISQPAEEVHSEAPSEKPHYHKIESETEHFIQGEGESGGMAVSWAIRAEPRGDNGDYPPDAVPFEITTTLNDGTPVRVWVVARGAEHKGLSDANSWMTGELTLCNKAIRDSLTEEISKLKDRPSLISPYNVSSRAEFFSALSNVTNAASQKVKQELESYDNNPSPNLNDVDYQYTAVALIGQTLYVQSDPWQPRPIIIRQDGVVSGHTAKDSSRANGYFDLNPGDRVVLAIPGHGDSLFSDAIKEICPPGGITENPALTAQHVLNLCQAADELYYESNQVHGEKPTGFWRESAVAMVIRVRENAPLDTPDKPDKPEPSLLVVTESFAQAKLGYDSSESVTFPIINKKGTAVVVVDGEANDGGVAKRAGEKAREAIVTVITQGKIQSARETAEIEGILCASLESADKELREATSQAHEKHTAFATVVYAGAMPDGSHKAVIAYVGNNRVYLLRGFRRKLQQVTLDDAIAEDTEDPIKARQRQTKLAKEVNPAEQLSRDEYVYLYQELNTRAKRLGEDEITPKIVVIDIKPGDRLLVCTKGVPDNLPLGEMQSIMAGDADDKATAKDLVDEACSSYTMNSSAVGKSSRYQEEGVTAVVMTVRKPASAKTTEEFRTLGHELKRALQTAGQEAKELAHKAEHAWQEMNPGQPHFWEKLDEKLLVAEDYTGRQLRLAYESLDISIGYGLAHAWKRTKTIWNKYDLQQYAGITLKALVGICRLARKLPVKELATKQGREKAKEEIRTKAQGIDRRKAKKIAIAFIPALAKGIIVKPLRAVYGVVSFARRKEDRTWENMAAITSGLVYGIAVNIGVRKLMTGATFGLISSRQVANLLTFAPALVVGEITDYLASKEASGIVEENSRLRKVHRFLSSEKGERVRKAIQMATDTATAVSACWSLAETAIAIKEGLSGAAEELKQDGAPSITTPYDMDEYAQHLDNEYQKEMPPVAADQPLGDSNEGDKTFVLPKEPELEVEATDTTLPPPLVMATPNEQAVPTDTLPPPPPPSATPPPPPPSATVQATVRPSDVVPTTTPEIEYNADGVPLWNHESGDIDGDGKVDFEVYDYDNDGKPDDMMVYPQGSASSSEMIIGIPEYGPDGGLLGFRGGEQNAVLAVCNLDNDQDIDIVYYDTVENQFTGTTDRLFRGVDEYQGFDPDNPPTGVFPRNVLFDEQGDVKGFIETKEVMRPEFAGGTMAADLVRFQETRTWLDTNIDLPDGQNLLWDNDHGELGIEIEGQITVISFDLDKSTGGENIDLIRLPVGENQWQWRVVGEYEFGNPSQMVDAVKNAIDSGTDLPVKTAEDVFYIQVDLNGDGVVEVVDVSNQDMPTVVTDAAILEKISTPPPAETTKLDSTLKFNGRTVYYEEGDPEKLFIRNEEDDYTQVGFDYDGDDKIDLIRLPVVGSDEWQWHRVPDYETGKADEALAKAEVSELLEVKEISTIGQVVKIDENTFVKVNAGESIETPVELLKEDEITAAQSAFSNPPPSPTTEEPPKTMENYRYYQEQKDSEGRPLYYVQAKKDGTLTVKEMRYDESGGIDGYLQRWLAEERQYDDGRILGRDAHQMALAFKPFMGKWPPVVHIGEDLTEILIRNANDSNPDDLAGALQAAQSHGLPVDLGRDHVLNILRDCFGDDEERLRKMKEAVEAAGII